MTKADQIRENLKKLAAGATGLLIGKVTAVDRDKQCCSAKCVVTDDVYHHIRLNASMDEREGVVIVPRVDSEVAFIPLANNGGGVVVAFGEVDEVKLNNADTSIQLIDDQILLDNGNCTVHLNGNKIAFKNTQADLKGLLEEIKTVITNLKVMTAVGPSVGLMPDSMTALTNLGLNINTLLE